MITDGEVIGIQHHDKVGEDYLRDIGRSNITTELFKVPISWLGILHIYNIWNPVIRIAIYFVVRKFYLHGLFGC